MPDKPGKGARSPALRAASSAEAVARRQARIRKAEQEREQFLKEFKSLGEGPSPTQDNPYGMTSEKRAASKKLGRRLVEGGLHRKLSKAEQRDYEASVDNDLDRGGDVLTARTLCSQLILKCASGGTDYGRCFRSVRHCATETPWKSEKLPCCAARCEEAYNEHVRGGMNPVLASITAVMGGKPPASEPRPCMP